MRAREVSIDTPLIILDEADAGRVRAREVSNPHHLVALLIEMPDACARVRCLHGYESGAGVGFVKKIGWGMPRM